MTRSEWGEIMALYGANWPHQTIPDAAAAKWYDDLKDCPALQVRAAVEACYREGREFPPNGAQVLAKIGGLARDDPDLDRAWQLIRRANVKFGLHHEHNQRGGLAWLTEQSPAVAEAARRFGLDSLGNYDIDDEGTIRAQFRDFYRAVLREREHDAAYTGLPDAGLRRLQRAPRRLGDVVAEIATGDGRDS